MIFDCPSSCKWHWKGTDFTLRTCYVEDDGPAVFYSQRGIIEIIPKIVGLLGKVCAFPIILSENI